MLSLSFAKEEDLPVVVHLAQKLFEISYHSRFSTFDFDTTMTLGRVIISDKTKGIIIVLKSDGQIKGLIVGKVVEPIFNKTEKLALELCFFIEPEIRHGIRLLYGAFRMWAKLVGCKTIMMGKIKEYGKQEEYYLKRIK